MNELSLDRINAKASYYVTLYGRNSFRFVSDFGVKFSIDFDESFVFKTVTAYELSIVNLNNLPSPRDRKMRDTIGVILEEFFHENQVGVLYICDTGDSKQAMRSRLFLAWLDMFNAGSDYMIVSAVLEDEEQVNYAAMILRKDNPDYEAYIAEFEASAEFFNDKPSRS